MSRDPSVITDQFLHDITTGPRASYRPPVSAGEAVTGLTAVLAGDVLAARAAWEPSGFTIVEATDPVTGRPYLLACSAAPTARRGGLFLVDRSSTPSLCVGVPHPDADQACLDLGLRLWRAVPGSMLVLAMAPPGSPGRTDPTRDTTSLFHVAWAQAAGPRGMTQVQIGSFTGRPPRGPAGWAAWGRTGDVLVSVGSAGLTLPALRIAERVEATGLQTRRVWDDAVEQKPTSRKNAQSRTAGRHHWAWVALTVGPMVRSTPARWHAVADAVARADPARYRLVDLGTALGGRVVVDASLGDHFLLRLGSDASLDLAGTPGAGARVLLHVEAWQEPHTLRLITDPGSVDTDPAGRTTITVVPGRPWYGVLRREDAGRRLLRPRLDDCHRLRFPEWTDQP
jgi:hypothetical protein